MRSPPNSPVQGVPPKVPRHVVAIGRFLLRIRPAPLAAVFKALLLVRRREVTTSEGKFWVDPASYQGLRIIETGTYEPAMVATLREHLRPGGTFIDLGANEGYFSVVGGLLVGPGGRVISIEPQARLQPVLVRNFALNGVGRQIRLVPAAVSDQPGHARLHLTPGLNNSASSLAQPTRYPLARQTVVTATLEQVADESGIGRCDLLKIDIEGWEYEAVLGSRPFFRERRAKAIALELHAHLLSARGLDGAKITGFLEECGYRLLPGKENLVFVVSD